MVSQRQLRTPDCQPDLFPQGVLGRQNLGHSHPSSKQESHPGDALWIKVSCVNSLRLGRQKLQGSLEIV